MEKLSFRAGEVEGPLDLILTLIARHKLNIYDIEISTLVEQYTEAVRQMEEADLEVGSEFIEMAARLVYIKTVELLPKHEKDEDPRRELTGQLLEYQACRQAAALLAAQSRLDDVFTRPAMAVGGGSHLSALPSAGGAALSLSECAGKGGAVPAAAHRGVSPHCGSPLRFGGFQDCFDSAPPVPHQPHEFFGVVFPKPGAQ